MLTYPRITVAITGASGLQYALRLLQCLFDAGVQVNLLYSQAAQVVAAMECGITLPNQTSKAKQVLRELLQFEPEQLQIFSGQQWSAPIASGSAICDAMVVCPCSSGSVAAIAQGSSDNLIERAADVMIKEQRKLILVHRETPLSVIHLENLLKLAKLGVTILPANPGFYHQPQSVDDIVDFIVARILDHLKVPHQLMKRWAE